MENMLPESGVEKKKSFREFVEHFVKNDTLFPLVEIGGGYGKMSVIDAIEKGKIALYLELCGYDELNIGRHNAIGDLTIIYDELQKESPDQKILNEAVARL